MPHATIDKTSIKLTGSEWLYCFCCLAIFVCWALFQEFNYAPDEYSRFLLPEYIYQNHSLPNGWDPAVRFAPQGISFAFRFTFLPAIVGAAGMSIASFFSQDPGILLFGARCASILFGLLAVYFSIKISKLLFKGTARWIFIVLMSLIPQFIFLCSYVNNDIACVCCSLVISYGWIRALREGWSGKNCLYLAIGVAGCLLSYYNGYAWVLLSIVFFFGICWIKKTGVAFILKRATLSLCVVLVLAGGFVVRNAILYDGDVLGSSSSEESGLLYADTTIIMPDSAHELGYSLTDVLTGQVPDYLSLSNWIKITVKSFFGTFGYMSDWLPSPIYYLYVAIFAVGIGCFTISLLTKLLTKQNIQKTTVLLYVCLLFVFAITLAIDLHFSIFTSYQPQGRYLYPALLPIVLVVSKGYDCALSKVKNGFVRNSMTLVFCFAFFILACYVALFHFFPNAIG